MKIKALTVMTVNDGGSRFLRNNGNDLPDYRISHPRRHILLGFFFSLFLSLFVWVLYNNKLLILFTERLITEISFIQLQL
jgi:hypothetical protein